MWSHVEVVAPLTLRRSTSSSDAGATAPRFALVNAVDGETVAFQPGDGNLAVVIFTCNHCPFANAFEPRIIELAMRYRAHGVRFYAIDSNDDVRFPDETLAAMKARAVARAYPFPYLEDGQGAIARAYGARVTPHVYVVDGAGAIRYRGHVDDSARPEERRVAGLADALDELLTGKRVSVESTRPFGCTIKFRS